MPQQSFPSLSPLLFAAGVASVLLFTYLVSVSSAPLVATWTPVWTAGKVIVNGKECAKELHLVGNEESGNIGYSFSFHHRRLTYVDSGLADKRDYYEVKADIIHLGDYAEEIVHHIHKHLQEQGTPSATKLGPADIRGLATENKGLAQKLAKAAKAKVVSQTYTTEEEFRHEGEMKRKADEEFGHDHIRDKIPVEGALNDEESIIYVVEFDLWKFQQQQQH